MVNRSTIIVAMDISTHDTMLTWVGLVHAGSYLPRALGDHLHEELGISLPEQDLLKQLDVAGGELKLVELSRRIYLSKAGITKMVDRLETKGLVTRVQSETDRRVVMARLAASGKKVVTRSRTLIVRWVEANLREHLSDMQLLALRDALETLLKGHGRLEGQMAHLRGGA